MSTHRAGVHVKTCTTCGEAFEDDVEICPRDGTPLFAFASSEPEPEVEPEPEHKVGTLEEASDALATYGEEEPDESFDEDALFLDPSSVAEDEEVLEPEEIVLEEVSAPADRTAPFQRANVFDSDDDGVAHDDPTLATDVGDRDELQRKAMLSIGMQAQEIEAQLARGKQAKTQAAPDDDGFGSAAAPEPEPFFDDGFGVPDPAQPQQPPAEQPRGQQPGPGESKRTAMGMPTFQAPSGSAGPPHQQRPPQQRAPQQQGQQQQRPPHQQRPQQQQPAQNFASGVQTELPSESFEAVPVDATANFNLDGPQKKKGSGLGRAAVFFFFAIAIGIGIGGGVYLLGLVPTDLLRGSGDSTSNEAPPAVVPTETEEPEPLEVDAVAEAPDTGTSDEESADAGAPDAGGIDVEEAGVSLAESTSQTATMVSEGVAENVGEEKPPKRPTKRRPKRRRKPKPKPKPKVEKSESGDIDIWGSSGKKETQKPAKEEPAKEEPAKKEPAEEKDESLDIW